jgi:polar amino acid transport system substrate-binding protein
MKITLATEVYPPRAGGAGWSTRALALALRAAGHDVSVLTTSHGPEDLDGLRVRRLAVSGRKRLSVPRAFARETSALPGVVHAQHSLSALGCLAGAESARVAVTVRDHWPVCFWSTRISRGALCPECGLVPMTRCVEGRVKAPAPISWGALPYMRADLREKRAALTRAGATLAVSEAIARELRAFAAAIASGRVYGNRLTRALLTGYVEIMRGTPILLQLFVLYYGLATAVRLPAFLAALLGLALNYAAYESEIYRGALEAVPAGQLEAARILGLTERQILLLVRGPQAFRLALAPMTNDFVALLKDSSLVSVLTVLELTKQTQIFATNIGSWVIPGLLCAALYLAMSLPLAALARRLERRWKRATV